jgi:hypothetical protein
MASKEKFVRFVPAFYSDELSPFAGWEGKAVPDTETGEEGMWRVEWQRKPEGLPELVHKRHLSFAIRKFSKRFAH